MPKNDNNNKKYKIITSIEDDAPYGDINWCSISFLTPQKIEKTKFLDIKGFKIHNGYNSGELANNDAKMIKEKNKNHDVYISQLGKIYGWDDATKTDTIEYGDDKLNELEKTRKESIVKIQMMSEQFKAEYKTKFANINKDRVDVQKKRMHKQLYAKGLISKKEYELMLEENKPVAEIKEIATNLEQMDKEINECYSTDYLDENDSVCLKYGCITIFSPKNIGGLKTLCFKIRGLFQTPSELTRRVKKLQDLYPNDRIYTFEVGKWCAFSEKDGVDPLVQLKQLNYGMKIYLDNLQNENEEFEKRKASLMDKTEKESKVTQTNNRREKRRAKREAAKKKTTTSQSENIHNSQTNQTNQTNPTPVPTDSSTMPTDSIASIGNPEDDDAIQKILDYLDDPELRNKFVMDKSTLERMEVDV